MNRTPASIGLLMAGLLLGLVSCTQHQPVVEHTLVAHYNSVLCLTFTQDSKTLISSGRDDTIRLWDVASGNLLRTIQEHKSDVYCVEFSHDGRLMASGSMDNTIILWDARTYTPIRTLTGHTAAVREVRFSPDDKTLASVAEDSTFRLWDVQTGNPKVTRTEHTEKIKSIAYTPDGKMIVTGSHDLTVRLWDSNGEPKQVLKGHKGGLESVAVSPDGKQLLSGSNNGQIIFWELPSGRMLKDLPNAHGNELGTEIDVVCYAPDGSCAASGCVDRTVKFWDPHTFELRCTLGGHTGRIQSMTFSPDGRILATGYGGADDKIRLWDLTKVRPN
jgi:WD40 repeat protein